jgi:GNAT superfamily N-acetyltransferase
MSDLIQYAQINVPSPHYDSELILRNRLLRAPLGLTLSTADTEGEEHQIHIGAFNEEQLIGCVVVASVDDDARCFRIRQMAVQDNYQGKGIGRNLIQQAEKIIQQQNGLRIVNHPKHSSATPLAMS